MEFLAGAGIFALGVMFGVLVIGLAQAAARADRVSEKEASKYGEGNVRVLRSDDQPEG